MALNFRTTPASLRYGFGRYLLRSFCFTLCFLISLISFITDHAFGKHEVGGETRQDSESVSLIDIETKIKHHSDLVEAKKQLLTEMRKTEKELTDFQQQHTLCLDSLQTLQGKSDKARDLLPPLKNDFQRKKAQ